MYLNYFYQVKIVITFLFPFFLFLAHTMQHNEIKEDKHLGKN